MQFKMFLTSDARAEKMSQPRHVQHLISVSIKLCDVISERVV